MRPYEPPRSATAQRPTWQDLPAEVRTLVEDRVGGVRRSRSQGSGYTPGFASRLTTADGSFFVKAVDRETPFVHASYRREAEVNAVLPVGLPRPALLWTAEGADWLVLCFQDVEGRSPNARGAPMSCDRCSRCSHPWRSS